MKSKRAGKQTLLFTEPPRVIASAAIVGCLLYTSDAADEL